MSRVLGIVTATWLSEEIACAVCCETLHDVVAAPRDGLHCWCVELEALDGREGQDVDDAWLEYLDRACDDARDA